MARFGPRALEKFRARAENRKTQFPGARAPETEEKCHHAVRDGCPQLFCTLCSGRPDPPRAGNREIRVRGFRPFWPRMALGTWINPGAGPKTKKCNFPGLGHFLGGEVREPKNFSPRKCATLFLFMFWPTRPPWVRNRELQAPGFVGHFGPGRALALRGIRGGKQDTANSHIETEKRETNPLQPGPDTQS